MALITWPVTIPQKPIPEGYSVKGKDLVIRTQMDEGDIKVRKRFSDNTEFREVSFIMDTTQKNVFKSFYENTTGGALRFDWVDPEDGVTVYEWRFASTPSYMIIGNGLWWKISFTIERMV